MSQRVVFQYNNVKRPFFLVKVFDGNTLVTGGMINCDINSLESGLPNNFDGFVSTIKRFLTIKNIETKEAMFLLNCSEFFKLSTIIPSSNNRKAKKLYENELSRKIENIADFDRYSTVGIVPNGKIFYEYLLSKHYIDFFKNVGQSLGFEKISYDLLPYYLLKTLKYTASKNFAYFYENYNVVNLMLVIDGVLCSCASFENKDEDYALAIISTIDKHYYEYEKLKIDIFVANKEIPYLEYYKPQICETELGARIYEGKNF